MEQGDQDQELKKKKVALVVAGISRLCWEVRGARAPQRGREEASSSDEGHGFRTCRGGEWGADFGRGG